MIPTPTAPLSVVLLTTKSENHIREMELCLKMRPWAESFGILDYETRLQGTGRSETKMRGYSRDTQHQIGRSRHFGNLIRDKHGYGGNRHPGNVKSRR